MFEFTPITDALPVLTVDFSLSSQPATLDARSWGWIRDLALKATKPKYILHPDFLPGYQDGFEAFQEDVKDMGEYPSFEMVMQNIEYSLSRKSYNMHAGYAASCGDPYPSYEWQVGTIFGWLAALLQTSLAPDFPFLLAPIAAMQSLFASSVSCVVDGSF